jgi:hypothetical protein
MKKSILSIVLTLLVAIAFAQHTKKDLVGKWEGLDDANQKGAVIFKNGDYMAMSAQGDKPRYFSYTADFSKTPAPLDILAKGPNGKTSTLKCLIHFLDANRIKLQIFYGSERSANFNPRIKNSILILKRIRK